MTTLHAKPETDTTGDGVAMPHGWQRIRLADAVTEVQAGFAVGDRDPSGVIQLRMNNVTTAGTWDWSSFIRVPADKATVHYYSLRPGDVLFNNTNSTEMVGKSAVFEGHSEPVVFSNHFTRIRTNSESLEPAFLGHWLLTLWQRGEFARICDRWIGQSAVQRGKLLALEIPLPPLPEQRRVAARLREQLAEVTKARAAVQAQLDAAEVLSAAQLRTVFSAAVQKKWPAKPLADVAEISGGVTLGRDLRGRPTRPVPYLRVANVKDGWLDLGHVKEVEATDDEIQACRLQYGDLLLTEGGDPDKLGRGTYWQDQLPECIHQNHIFRVRFDHASFDPAFVASQVGSPYGKAYFLAHAKQTTGIATINRTVLSRYPLLAPPLSEQRAVSARLAAEQKQAAHLAAHLREELAALDHLPAALLRDAFSGRL